MAKIPVSYQPNKIKKGSYTDWIDGGKFCTSINPTGSDTPPTSGLNLLDAFDVDWSAYKLGGQSASANKIIEKLNELQQLPQSPDRLIYYNEGEGFVSDYLVLNDGTLVVDKDADLDLCKGKSDIETDILGAWQQWTEIKSTSPEYGTGTYTTNLGYGRWYTNANGEVLNKVNSTDFNGYIMPFARQSYAIESILGTNIGNTTGDNIGFSIVNDKNAVPRHVITNTGRTYYRNTLYDIYADGASGESTAIHPIKSAWVCDDKTSNTAYVIYTTSPTSGAEADLSGDHLVYYIDNIKTSKGRRKYKTADLTSENAAGTETVTANVAASGTIDFISITVTNSASMELGHSTGVSGSTGTVYVFGSRYNISNGSWSNEKVFTGTSTDLGNLLVAYQDSLNTNASGNACIIKTYVDVNKGVLTIKFSDSTKYGETPSYNGSVLKIDCTKKKYYITPRSDYENQNIVENSLPTSTLNSDFWDGFTSDTKFMYHAFSYQNLYIKCLNVLMDNKIIYVHDDGTNIEFGPNADRSDYEEKGNVSTQNVLKGSRLVYNPITKKTFYSDGTKLFHIASVEVEQASVVPSTCNEKFLGFISDSSVFTVSDKNRTAGQYWIVASDFTPTFEGFDLKDRQADPLYTGDIVYVYEDYTSPIGSGSVFDSKHRVVRYSSYLPLSGTRDGLPLTGSINIGNCRSLVDQATAVLNVKLSEEDEEAILNATSLYVPLVGCTDSTGDHYYLMDVCYFSEDLNKPMISFPYGICPGQSAKVNIGHATDKFNEVYASHFIVDPDSTDILLANGTTLSQSEITAGGDYLPLSGGTMSGNITFSANTSIVFDQRGEISEYGQNGLRLEADSAEVALEQGHIMLNGTKVTANCNVEATAFFETSDIRKKEIKSDLSLEKCYDVIDKCQTIIYSLKDQTTEQLGMIAQEIEEFFPEVVQTDSDGFKSLAYDRLVVICFKVLKDVIKRLEQLENGL